MIFKRETRDLETSSQNDAVRKINKKKKEEAIDKDSMVFFIKKNKIGDPSVLSTWDQEKSYSPADFVGRDIMEDALSEQIKKQEVQRC